MSDHIPASEPWTDDEREFLRESAGDVFAALTGEPGVREHAHDSAAEVVRALTGRYPNRAHRLLIFQALAVEIRRARDEVLRDLLRATMQWARHSVTGRWTTVGLQDWERDWIAKLAGVTPQTVAALYRKLLHESHDLLDQEAEDEPARADATNADASQSVGRST